MKRHCRLCFALGCQINKGANYPPPFPQRWSDIDHSGALIIQGGTDQVFYFHFTIFVYSILTFIFQLPDKP